MHDSSFHDSFVVVYTIAMGAHIEFSEKVGGGYHLVHTTIVRVRIISVNFITIVIPTTVVWFGFQVTSIGLIL